MANDFTEKEKLFRRGLDEVDWRETPLPLVSKADVVNWEMFTSNHHDNFESDGNCVFTRYGFDFEAPAPLCMALDEQSAKAIEFALKLANKVVAAYGRHYRDGIRMTDEEREAATLRFKKGLAKVFGDVLAEKKESYAAWLSERRNEPDSSPYNDPSIDWYVSTVDGERLARFGEDLDD